MDRRLKIVRIMQENGIPDADYRRSAGNGVGNISLSQSGS